MAEEFVNDSINNLTEDLNSENEMVEVIGIRFKDGGKIYYFDPNGCTGTTKDFAIVDTSRGTEFGKVYQENKFVSKDEIVSPLRPVIRIATEKDLKTNEENKK
ncbi:MAG: hypothetical protein IKA02_01015, partial [Clostridia bacterium]|nr:hypothetical protein [Clostridia bacterium]